MPERLSTEERVEFAQRLADADVISASALEQIRQQVRDSAAVRFEVVIQTEPSDDAFETQAGRLEAELSDLLRELFGPRLLECEWRSYEQMDLPAARATSEGAD